MNMNYSELTNNPLVSIIIITYNSSRFVVETLESAKAQSYKNIELIITDDCSKDNTVEICKQWLAKNKEFFVRTELITVEKNTGIAKNCGRGLHNAKGKWLKFIAGDDILLENCILDNLLYLDENPEARFITSKIQTIDEQSNLLKTKDNSYDSLQKLYFTKSSAEQLKLYARLPFFLNSPAFFMNKALVVSAGGFDERFKIYEDICLIFRINSSNEKVHYLDKITVKYRIHEDAISRSKNAEIDERRRFEQILIFDKYRRKNLNKLNLIDLSVYYETWLNYKYRGFFGHKANKILLKFSLFYWYLKIKLK